MSNNVAQAPENDSEAVSTWRRLVLLVVELAWIWFGCNQILGLRNGEFANLSHAAFLWQVCSSVAVGVLGAFLLYRNIRGWIQSLTAGHR